LKIDKMQAFEKFVQSIFKNTILSNSLLLLLFVSIWGGLPSETLAQYTAPAPDTTKKSEHHYSLRDVKVAFLPIQDDNSRITVDSQFAGAKALPPSLVNSKEKHLTNIRQLTFGGENAEAYLSPDEKHISFQARSLVDGACDQIFTMTLDGKDVERVSSGHGKTTCSYYLPSGDKVLYASTEAAYAGACPPEPDRSHGYVWSLDPAYDIYVRDTNGTLIGRLTDNSSYYDAEATVSPKGDRIVFTSTRSGDVDLYSMNIDGSDVKQLTDEEGYDGGAFFSQDGSKIVYRASRPVNDELKEYRDLLKQGLIKPHTLELYTMNADGSNKKQVTHSNAASFAPFFFPDAKRIIFSSNMDDPAGREFELYMINTDGSGLERLTYSPGFDGFPIFTADGKHLIFCSNRNSTHPHETNIFIADWVD
jgi:Tol biopolymer transport system component